MTTYKGTTGNDTITGSANNDKFDIEQGGEDVATGLGGNDIFSLGQGLDAGDSIDGGTGINEIILRGDYSAGLTFGADTVLNIHRIVLSAGFSYDLVTADATVAAGQTMVVQGSKLGAGDTLTFDGAAQTDGSLDLIGGAGDDVLTGGQAGDNFNLSFGGEDTVHGGTGDDVIAVGAALDAGDTIDGGGGRNVLRLRGDYSAGLTLGATTIANIQVVQLDVGHSYNLTLDAANFPAGASILINAEALHAGNVFTFDAATSMADFHIIGGAASDVLTGGNASSTFDLSVGGNDTATGGNAHDSFRMGAALGANDKIDGGGGSDTVELDGDYSSRLTFKATTISNVETLLLDTGHSYNLETNDANVAAGATMLVAGNILGASDTLTFDGSAETDGHFIIRGGAGNDVLTGGQDGDTFNLLAGGDDTAHGGRGDDVFNVGATLTAADFIDGGAGNDTVALNGDYSAGVVFGAATLANVETVSLAAGHSYNLTTNDANIASGATMTLDGSALGVGDSLVFNGAAETDGTFAITGGAGDDNLTGGAQADTFDLTQGGADTAHGGGGDDNFRVDGASAGADTIDGGAGNDTLTLTAGGTLNASLISSVENFAFNGDASSGYDVAVIGDLTAGGGTLSLNFQQIQNGGVTIDLTGATTANFDIVGSAGEDTVILGPGENLSNFFFGGNYDTLELSGGSTGLTLDAATIQGFSDLTFADGASYTGIILIGDIVDNAGPLTIDASALTGSNSVNVDLSQETTIAIYVTGGAGDDTFAFSQGSLGVVQSFDGGGGNNTLGLNGQGTDFSVNLQDSVFQNIQNIVLDDGNNYGIGISGDITSGHGTLSIDAGALSSAYGANINLNSATTSTIDITGGAGDDVVSVWSSNVTVDFSHGGNDTFYGGPGNALIEMGGALDAGDQIYGLGGPGTTTVSLHGDYSAGITLSMLSAVNEVELGSGFNYNITLDPSDSNSFLLDGSSLGAGDSLTADASPVTSGVVTIDGGAGNDTITVGSSSGDISAGAGDDIIIDNSFLGSIDGGAGNDTLMLNGAGTDLAATLSDSSISNIRNVSFDDGNNYNLTISGDIGSAGALTVQADALTGSNALTLDLTAATTASIQVIGGAGDDTVAMGGNLASATIDGGSGDNIVTLDGDYTAGITLSMLTNIAEVDLAAGHSYTITLAASNASSGDFYLDGDALGAGDSLTADSTAVTSGEVDIDGGAGNDTITTGVTSGNTYLDLSLGGEDTVHGGSANDSIYMGNALDTGDRIDGGGGFNYVYLEGDSYAGGFNLSGGALTNVNYVQVFGNHTYVLTGDSAVMNSSHFVTIDGGAMTGGSLQFDGSAVTGGAFSLYGGAGNDILLAGSGNDTLDLSVGGEDQLAGNGGNDIINAGGGLDAGDQVDGGTGTDTMNFGGDYSAGLVLGATTVTNVESFVFAAGHSYNITTDDATVASGATLTVNASALGAGDSLTFNGAAETDGFFNITGGAGNDVLTGGALADTFDLSKGGDDTVNGGLGNDSFAAGGALTAADTINGGGGTDTLTLNGDYSSALTFGASTITNISNLTVSAGHNYDLITNDGNLASGATLTVTASALGSANTLIFDGSAETDGFFSITGGAGDDVITGGAQADSITLGSGGNDTVHAGDGADQIFMMTQWTSADVIDGGAGSDFLGWGGKDYTGASALVLSATSLNSVEEIQCNSGHAYSLTMNDANVAAGATVLIDSTRSTKFTFDGSAETDGHLQIAGGAGADVLTGGQLSDTFMFYAVAGSTNTGYDTITNMDFSSDLVWLDSGSTFMTDYKPTGVDAAITTGALSTATFNTDLATAVNSATLAAHHAVLFTADSGTLSGHTFLVVDHNGAAGYQSGSDYVIDVTGYAGTLSTASFT